MKQKPTNHPSYEIYMKMNVHIDQLKQLLNEIEPSERLVCINEIFESLLPEKRTTPVSAQEKIGLRLIKGGLSEQQQNLIDDAVSSTINLYRFNQEEE